MRAGTFALSDISFPVRLTALDQLGPLDAVSDTLFAPVTRLATRLLGMPISAVTLFDRGRDRAVFKGGIGLGGTEWPLDTAFCHHTHGSRELLVVPDLVADARFRDHPLVTGRRALRFYAGAPLLDRNGAHIGALGILDHQPRATLDAAARATLTDLAQMSVAQIERLRLERIGDIATRIADAMCDAVICTDAHGRIIFWSSKAEQMYGHPADIALGRRVDLIVPMTQRPLLKTLADAVARGEPCDALPLSTRHASGDVLPVEVSLARWGHDATGGIVAVVRDLSNHRRLEEETRHARTFLDTIVEHLPAMLFVKDARTRRYLLVNRAGAEMIGRPRDELIGRTDRELFANGLQYEQNDDEALRTDQIGAPVESSFIGKGGQRYDVRTRRIVIEGPDSPRQYIIGLSENVSDTRRAEAQVELLAHFDPITGVRNRLSYLEQLQVLTEAGSPSVLVAIALDRLKVVNDQFGHVAGDMVLTEAGQRLTALVAPGDMVARAGDNEFVLLLVGEDAAARARAVAMAATDAMARPFVTVRGTAHLGAAIGAATYPVDADTAPELRRCADVALYHAKTRRPRAICFYNRAIDDEARDGLALEHDLRAAIANGQIDLAYQPVFAAASGRITSAEALARWTHPTRGPIGPAVFIALAEQHGLIVELGTALLHRACAAAVRWPADIAVAVNLSPLQFEGDSLLPTIQRTLAATGLPASRLQLEVTEGLLIRDVEHTFRQLERLRGLGIRILMDDFGTGYSALGYLQRFPFDKVKIDQSFVRELGTHVTDAIVRAVAGLGQALNMSVVAEGVETEEQMAALVAAGCTHVQGYLLGKPIPNDALDRLLRAQQAIHD